jgi:2-methylcitrate dehydratase PrpD
VTVTTADTLGSWAAGFRLELAPLSVVRAAKRSLIDVVGVALAGAQRDVAVSVHELVRTEYGPGPCTVVGTWVASSASGAALANGVAAHVLDFDDTSYDGIVHASAVVWPAAMAAGELVQASGMRFLEAFVAGVEVECALGRALMDRLYWKGWWSTAVLGIIGASAGAARALGLDPADAGQAIRIAACQATGPRVLLGTPTKPYACGRAAQAGLQAALAARAGLTGPPAAFEHERGFVRLFNNGVQDATLLDALGRRFSLETPGVAIKLYPVCSAAQAAVEAVIVIMTDERLCAGDIRLVQCEVTPLVAMSLAYGRPHTVTEAQFSMPFAIGCALAFGRLDVDHLTESTLRDPRLAEAMAKVEMRASDHLFETPEGRRDHPEGAAVTVHTVDGRAIRRLNGAATGMPANPIADSRLEEKFRTVARRAVTDAAADQLLARLAVVETLESLTELFAGLRRDDQQRMDGQSPGTVARSAEQEATVTSRNAQS